MIIINLFYIFRNYTYVIIPKDMQKLKNNYKNYCINLLVNKLHINKQDILFLRYQPNGYTNKTFIVKLKNNKQYIVRIGSYDDLLHRSNEYNIYSVLKRNKLINYLYFDKKSGDMIREYIVGHTPTVKQCHSLKFIKLITKTLKQYHNIKLLPKDHILENDYYLYQDVKFDCDKKYDDLYYQLIKKNKNLEKVFSHSDFSRWNIIYNKSKSKVTLIDFEWGRIDYRYFDLANFIKESKIHNTKYEALLLKEYGNNLNQNTLTEFIYISAYFSYLWSFKMKNYKTILNYRKTSLNLVKQLYKEIKN